MPYMVADILSAPPRVANIDIGQGENTLAKLTALFAEHGDAFRMHSDQLGRDLFVLSHPNHVRHVLVDRASNYAKGLGIERVAILLGKGLIDQRRRSLARPAQGPPARVPSPRSRAARRHDSGGQRPVGRRLGGSR